MKNEELKRIQAALALTNAAFAEKLAISEITLKKYRTREIPVSDARLSTARLLKLENDLAGAMKIERDIVKMVRIASTEDKQPVELIHEPEKYRFRCGEIELSYRTGFIEVRCENRKNKLAETLRSMAEGWKIGELGR